MNILKVEKCEHSGTSFIGNYKTSYDKLVNTFGEPNFAKWYEDGNKTDSKSFVTWVLEFATDDINNPLVTVTIYDWKETDWKDVCNGEYDWHIGGYDDGLAVDLLAQWLEGGERYQELIDGIKSLNQEIAETEYLRNDADRERLAIERSMDLKKQRDDAKRKQEKKVVTDPETGKPKWETV